MATGNGRWTWLSAAVHAFFFGNWSYGVCAVALGVEAALQQQVHLNGALYHVAVFLATTAFYNYPYVRRPHEPGADERSGWYARHRDRQRWVQHALVGTLLVLLGWGVVHNYRALVGARMEQWVLFLVFPMVGAAYYGTGTRGLRRVGWLKPLLLGFVWAGVVTVYPVLFRTIVEPQVQFETGIGARLFFKNMMFCAVIGVLFDIKDHAADHRSALRTFIVQRGLRATLFRLALPLTALGWATFLWYGATHGFSAMKLLLNTLPFAALVAVVFALRRRRSLLYYLVVVDGLLVVKAVCGSVAMWWF